MLFKLKSLNILFLQAALFLSTAKRVANVRVFMLILFNKVNNNNNNNNLMLKVINNV